MRNGWKSFKANSNTGCIPITPTILTTGRIVGRISDKTVCPFLFGYINYFIKYFLRLECFSVEATGIERLNSNIP